MGAIITATQWEAIVQTGLPVTPGDVIDAAITREEAALALRIGGPLTGAYTQTLRPPYGHSGPLTLRRFLAGTVVVTDGPTTLATSKYLALADGLGRAGGCIERTDSAWAGVVTVTWTPADTAMLFRYLVEAVRQAIVPDRERVAAEDRASARLHRENAAAELARLMRDIEPAPRDWSSRVRVDDRRTPYA